MRPLSLGQPKGLLPFCGRPLVEYTLEQLLRSRIREAVLGRGPRLPRKAFGPRVYSPRVKPSHGQATALGLLLAVGAAHLGHRFVLDLELMGWDSWPLVAASREDTGQVQQRVAAQVTGKELTVVKADPDATQIIRKDSAVAQSPSAAEAAREVREAHADTRHVEADSPPTTRVVRGGVAKETASDSVRTTLVRGKMQGKRGAFDQDPVVGWLDVVGGPGIGQYRPIFEGNNTVGRAKDQRIPLDFGDDTISSEEQAYIRYDSAARSFLFVPNLAKTNVVSINDKRPTGAVELHQMDVITIGRTQLVFVPFCGAEFDWAELTDAKD